MSTVEAPVQPASGTQEYRYRQPVAAFRNQAKPLPDQPLVEDHDREYQVVQGYPEAVVSVQATVGGKSKPNVLQYLCRDPSPDGGFSLQTFAQGQYLCNGAVVIAQNTQPVPGNLNCFWIDETGALRQSWMTGPSSWSERYDPPQPASVPKKYDPRTWNTKLGNLHVAYTPATTDGNGRNPVLYAAQDANFLVTVKWGPDGWTTTVYDGLGGGLDYNDLTLVPTSEQSFDLIANVTKSSDLGLWSGTFGDTGSLSRSSSAFSGNPGAFGDGVLRQVICGSSSATGTTCAFYTDGDGNLLMWPAGSSHSRPTPVPVTTAGTPVGAGQLSGSGTRTNLYYVAGNGLWMSGQLIWTMDGQVPFFAPPSQIVPELGRSLVALAPAAHPAELPVVFCVASDGRLLMYRPSDYDGGVGSGYAAHQTVYGTGDWAGGPLNLANKQPFVVDTRSYS